MKKWICLFLAAVLFFTGIPVDVLAAEVAGDSAVSLSVISLPEKVNYLPGEALDLTGLVAEAAFGDGSVKSLDAEELTVAAPELSQPGDYTVTVSYDGQSASFEIHVHTVRILDSVEPTYMESGLTEGKICDTCGEVLLAQENVAVKDAPKLNAPVISAKVTSDGVTVSWKAVKYAQCYQVIRKYAGGEWTRIDTVTGTRFTDSDVKTGTKVYYSVRACLQTANGLARSSRASSVSVYFVSATVSNTKDGVSIKWTALDEASYYRVYRRIPGGSWEVIRSKSTDTSFVDETAKPGVTYQYAVRAYAKKWLTNYHYDLEITRLEQPEFKVSNKSGGVRITWNEVTGAENYRVYRKVSGGSWKRLTTMSGTSYLDQTAESGTTYTYTVRAMYGDSFSSNQQRVAMLRLSSPKATISNSYTGISVKWTAVKGAESYRVMRRVPGGSWKTVATDVEDLSYTDTSVKSGTAYQYAVRAYCDGVLSGYTSTGSRTYLSRPVIKAKTLSTTSIRLYWNAVEGADEYILSVQNDEGKWVKVATVSGTKYTVSNLTFGKTYTYSVRAISGSQRSTRSKTVSAKATYPAPTYELALEPAEGIRISWTAVEGAGSYRVYRRTSDGSWKVLKTTTSTSYVDESGHPGTTYEYAVRAFELAGAKGISGVRADGKNIIFSKIDPDKPMVALTFDDGPSKYTTAILDQLEKYGAHATFFVVGNRVASFSNTIKRAYNMGCEIGNHSWSHPSLSSLSVSAMKRELSRTDEAIENVIGVTPELLRPPYGAVDSDVRKNAGKPLIHWSIDTRDWEHRVKSKTVSCVLSNVRDGSIVLMHDIYSATSQAAVSLIPTLIKRGYQLVTVSELAAYRGVELKNGTIYYSIK